MLRRISVFKNCRGIVSHNNSTLPLTSKVSVRSYTPCEDYASLAALTTETSEMEDNIKITREILNDISLQPDYLLTSIFVEERTELVRWGDYHESVLNKIEEYKEASEKRKEKYKEHGDYAERLLYGEKERLEKRITELKCCEYHSLLAHAICKNSLFSLGVGLRTSTRKQLVFHRDHRLQDLEYAFEKLYPRWSTIEDNCVGIIHEENLWEKIEKAYLLYKLYHRMKDVSCLDIEAEDLEFWDREMSSF